MNDQATYQRFIAAIDSSVAGTDEYGDLAWHVDCSAQANAGDMGYASPEEYWTNALSTAEVVLDDWHSYYPQLIPRTAPYTIEILSIDDRRQLQITRAKIVSEVEALAAMHDAARNNATIQAMVMHPDKGPIARELGPLTGLYTHWIGD
jgi:hypothetical protein